MTTNPNAKLNARPYPPEVMCEWYVICDHPAIGVVRHPVCGPVPTCRRCADKLDLLMEEAVTSLKA